MSQKILFLALIVFLTACAPVAPIVTVTPAPSATPIQPTKIPSTPTMLPTPEPTETRDPNMPSSVDAGFTLTGIDLMYQRYKEVDANQNARYWSPEIGAWTESRMENKQPIDLMGFGDSNLSATFPLPFSLYVSPDFKFASQTKFLYHPPGPTDFQTEGITYASLASNMGFALWYRETGLNRDTVQQKYNISTQEGKNQMYADNATFLRSIANGKTIDVNGSPVDLTKGVDIILINPNPSMKLTSGLNIQIIVKDKKVTALIAVGDPSLMDDDQFRNWFLSPLTAIITGPDPLPANIWWMDYQTYGSYTGAPVSSGGHTVTHPAIEFKPN